MELERRTLTSGRVDRRIRSRGDEDENDELAKEPAVGAAVVLLIVVFALDVYRAVTQSITHDEALTFHYYVPGPIANIFTNFGANDHVLHTLLAWVSVRLFGISEWALRLPALFGGLLYLVSSLRVCRRVFGGGWTFLLAFGLLALNPLLLDFQSMARGYGLGLGLSMYAIANLLGALAGHETGRPGTGPHGRLFRASAALGLSVAANLTFAPLAGGLLLLTAVAIIAQQRRLPGGAKTTGSVFGGLALLILPCLVTGGALLTVPLQNYKPGGFFVGLPNLLGTGTDLIDHALAHVPGAWPLEPESRLFTYVRGVLLVLAGPVLLLAALVRVVMVVRSWRGKTSLAELSGMERFHFLVGGSLVLGVLALVVAHHVFGFAYPIDRTGLWIVAVVHLVTVGLVVDVLRAGPLPRVVAVVVLAALWGLLVQYGSQIQAREYPIWRNDAGTSAIFDEIKRQNDREPRETVVVECAWFYEPALNFYRLARRTQWMPVVQRGYDPDDLKGDWLVLLPSEEERPVDELVEVRYQDPVSGTVLGIPRVRQEADER
ncbi:MAG: hypothetical protein ACYTG2_00305 [Planctomycetota bacterium]|jgi:hypothetical protein